MTSGITVTAAPRPGRYSTSLPWPDAKGRLQLLRAVTVVYGFDGPQAARLRSLKRAFSPAGWEIRTRAVSGSWADIDEATITLAGRDPGAVHYYRERIAYWHAEPAWQPGAAVGYPPGGSTTPPWGRSPLSPRMRVTWLSRGDEITAASDPYRAHATARNHLPLGVSEPPLPELIEEALRRHEHALNVIRLWYYSNGSPKRHPHRVRRYPCPAKAVG